MVRAKSFIHSPCAMGVRPSSPLVVVVMIAVFSLLSDVFLTVPNFRNVGVAAAALAAVSFGQTFAILTAGLDLSIGAAVALVSVTSALAMRRYGIPAGIGTALAVGCLAGLVNGLVVAKLKVFPFIATLATMSIMSGLALQLSAGVPVTGVPDSFSNLAYDRLFGIPMPVVIALLVLVVAALILRYTRVGRHLYAVGGNEEAARLSGIAIDRVKLFAYVLSGLCAAVGSLILTAPCCLRPAVARNKPAARGGLGSRARRRVAVRRTRVGDWRCFRGTIREHPVERTELTQRLVLHPDDGDRSRTDRGGGSRSGVFREARQVIAGAT